MHNHCQISLTLSRRQWHVSSGAIIGETCPFPLSQRHWNLFASSSKEGELKIFLLFYWQTLYTCLFSLILSSVAAVSFHSSQPHCACVVQKYSFTLLHRCASVPLIKMACFYASSTGVLCSTGEWNETKVRSGWRWIAIAKRSVRSDQFCTNRPNYRLWFEYIIWWAQNVCKHIRKASASRDDECAS